MPTRSRIGLQLPNGKIMSVYCHLDGYPSWVGSKLMVSYTTEDAVLSLMRLGDLYCLGDNVGECGAYHRDHGEELVEACVVDGREQFIQHAVDDRADYAYLFARGSWFVRSINCGQRFRKLTQRETEP